MRVLILTASYGSGHNAAAKTLGAGFARAGVVTRVVDHFRELVDPRFERATRALYEAVLRRVPSAWALAYELGDRMTSDSPLAFGMTQVGTEALGRLLDEDRPDAVVTVHATPAVAMSTLVAEGRRVPPHTTVVTDFVAHGQWIAPRIDRYCVAADEVRHEFIARGIPGERVLTTGVPVREAFETPVDPLAARAQLGLGATEPFVLAMAGSDGRLGRLADVVRVLARRPHPLRALVVAGRDARFAASLARLAAGTSVRTVGYATDVPALMAAADVLITKAGGMTIAEALAAEVPMIMYGSLPGQERRNERFASRAGVALVARSRAELVRALDQTLGDARLVEHLRARIRRARRPYATRDIVDVVLADVTGGKETGGDGARGVAR